MCDLFSTCYPNVVVFDDVNNLWTSLITITKLELSCLTLPIVVKMVKWLNALALEEKNIGETLVKLNHPFMQVVYLTIVM
jgi:hypothetical protein